jgi:hypothetical protein
MPCAVGLDVVVAEALRCHCMSEGSLYEFYTSVTVGGAQAVRCSSCIVALSVRRALVVSQCFQLCQSFIHDAAPSSRLATRAASHDSNSDLSQPTALPVSVNLIGCGSLLARTNLSNCVGPKFTNARASSLRSIGPLKFGGRCLRLAFRVGIKSLRWFAPETRQ